MLVGGVALGLLFRPWTMQVQVDSVVVLGMALIILLGTVVAFTAYLEGICCVGPKKGSLYASIEPVSATIFSSLWMKTEFGCMDLLGFACILSTIFLLSAGSPRTGSHIRNKVV
ncbi:MAG: DMT family transporter [Clostridiales bacterium]|nr:DMT family transporter [Clostridiales bacterium]